MAELFPPPFKKTTFTLGLCFIFKLSQSLFFFFKETVVSADLTSIPTMLLLEEFHTGTGPGGISSRQQQHPSP